MIVGSEGAMGKVGLSIGSRDAAVAAVRRTVQALSIRTGAISAVALALVGHIAIRATKRRVRHDDGSQKTVSWS